jgi:hypothetical protein
MQESSVYQHLLETTGKEHYERGLQQGAELGARQTAIKSLCGILEFKFDVRAVQALKPTLETIHDLQHLEQLHDAALRAQSLEAFVQNLETSRN